MPKCVGTDEGSTQVIPYSVLEMSTSLMSNVIQAISIYLAWIVQLL
jgi:hypothetical protein